MSDQDNETTPLLFVPDRRRRGRPRVSVEETVAVNTRLPITDYDRLIQMAKTRRTTLAGTLRDVLTGRLK
jgi:hypothetical protein